MSLLDSEAAFKKRVIEIGDEGFTHCKAMMLPLFEIKGKILSWTKLGSFLKLFP